jgi:hypothetical protein
MWLQLWQKQKETLSKEPDLQQPDVRLPDVELDQRQEAAGAG